LQRGRDPVWLKAIRVARGQLGNSRPEQDRGGEDTREDVDVDHGLGVRRKRPAPFSYPHLVGGETGRLESFHYPAFSAFRRPQTAQNEKMAVRPRPTAKATPTSVGEPARSPRPASRTRVIGFTVASVWIQP
jgi:hypothetical protein